MRAPDTEPIFFASSWATRLEDLRHEARHSEQADEDLDTARVEQSSDRTAFQGSAQTFPNPNLELKFGDFLVKKEQLSLFLRDFERSGAH